MLVLTRRTGQSIRIGDDIVIKIVDIDGSQVKIGIEAPKSIVIFREELYEKLRESNIEALKTAKELKLDDFIPKAVSIEKEPPVTHPEKLNPKESQTKGEKQ